MKIRSRLSWMIITVSFVVSCASGVPYTKLNPSLKPEMPDTGRIFFYRATTLGAAIQPSIIMNDEIIGKSIAQGFFFLDKPAGEYEVVTSTEVKRKVSFVLDNGQTRYIRFNVSLGFFVGHVYGELVEPEEAKNEIAKCKYVPSEGKVVKASQRTSLTHDELVKLFSVSREAIFTNSKGTYEIQYFPNGKHTVSKGSFYDTGDYRIQGDMTCSEWKKIRSGKERCSKVYLIGENSYQMIFTDGEIGGTLTFK